MKIVCGEAFVESLRTDLKEGKDTWIIFQNIKWNVISVSDKPCDYNPWGDEYEVEIELRKEMEQLTLFDL